MPVYGAWAHPYYIVAPDYRDESAGVRVLHYLCHILNGLGFEAYVKTKATSRELRTPPLTEEVIARHAALGLQPIAVYPEVVHGNPLNANVVARYLLYFAGHYRRRLEFMPWELVFSFAADLVPDGIAHARLYVPPSDLELFNARGVNPSDRTLTAFFANRYLQSGEPLADFPAGAIELSPRVPARSLPDLAEIFRKARVLYSYEWSTICYEAMLCGCPVALVPNVYLKAQLAVRPRSLAHLPLFFEIHEGNGVCIGLDEAGLRRATETVDRFREVYTRRALECLAQVGTFVELTQTSARRAAKAHRCPMTGPGPVPPAAGLKLLVESFDAHVSAGDLQSAESDAERIDGSLRAFMDPEADGAAADAFSVMLKLPGYCFLRGQHLLTIHKAAAESVPWFRMSACLCESSLAESPTRFAGYEALFANAMFCECLALGRLERGPELRSRADELIGRSWSNPVAALYVEWVRQLRARNAGEAAAPGRKLP